MDKISDRTLGHDLKEKGKEMAGRQRNWVHNFLKKLAAASCARAVDPSERVTVRRTEENEEFINAAEENDVAAHVDVGVVVEEEEVATNKDVCCKEVAAISVDNCKTEVLGENAAAIRIQAVFRGHLARRAFYALRSLVKLQALVRGTYVRRQAQVATDFMQTLVRLQVRVKERRQLLLNKQADA